MTEMIVIKKTYSLEGYSRSLFAKHTNDEGTAYWEIKFILKLRVKNQQLIWSVEVPPLPPLEEVLDITLDTGDTPNHVFGSLLHRGQTVPNPSAFRTSVMQRERNEVALKQRQERKQEREQKRMASKAPTGRGKRGRGK